VVYLVLWRALPLEEGSAETLNVVPESVGSANGTLSASGAEAAASDEEKKEKRRKFTVTASVVVGVIAAAGGFATLLTSLVDWCSLEQFWPLLVIAFGVVHAVIPSKDEFFNFSNIIEGVMCFVAGIMLLLATTGVVALDLRSLLVQNWGMLLLVIGLMAIGRATQSRVALCLSLGIFLIFCLIGFSLYVSVPVWDILSFSD